ncbi:hypothetical protein [uncultured Gimesia sp.]|jgi:hypothetical protein|uniref:hypothetical protein n=1 Tax=uncultured Gimesia sp. TaxID=1678688 RepID=UPI0026268E6A|nr:hypothetical protein [uncultured Gimesia sp.]
MKYDPQSLIDELAHYQEAAEEAFADGLRVHVDIHPDGSTVVKDGRIEAPDRFTIETVDDILPLAFYLHELTYRLESVVGDKATYKYS